MKADLSQTLSKLNMETQFPLSHSFVKLATAFWFLNDGHCLIFSGRNHRKIWKCISKISTFQDKLKEEASLSAFFGKVSFLNKAFLLVIRVTKFSVLVTKTEINGAVSYPAMTNLVVGAETCCGCSVPLHSCEQSSKDLKVCVLTGRNLGPSPQYFAQDSHFHSSATYRKKSVTMVPEMKEEKKKKQHISTKVWHHDNWLTSKSCVSVVCILRSIPPGNKI